jgi:hypothetical protein
MTKGRPFQPGNHFGRGRPRGSRNKRSLMAQELLECHAEAVTRQALVLALKGDSQMIRFLLSLIHPRRKDLPPKTGSLPMHSIAELSQASEKLIKKVTSGKVSISDALGLTELMERRRRIIETEDHEKRIQAVEQVAFEKEDD